MPRFSANAQKRIIRVVKQVEANMRDLTSSARGNANPASWRWFQLQEAFDSGSNYEADAYMCTWSASANSGDGELTVDSGTTYVVRDTLENRQCGNGDYVLCRPIGSVNYTVWEVVFAETIGPYFGKLDSDLAYSETTGVSVSIWSWSGSAWSDTTNDITGVLPPPTMSSGTIAQDTWVRIEKIGGYWFVTMAPCD